MNIVDKVRTAIQMLKDLSRNVATIQLAVGRIEAYQRHDNPSRNVRDYEFKVYSQWGEDGILQFLLRQIDPKPRIFIEFGVQNYTEANTRFLLCNNSWAGLVIDGSQENIDYIRRDSIYWLYNLKAECAFIDRDNINRLIERNGISGEIGLLSVDIDGNDYWVWQAITCVRPAIVVAEYNSLFGPARKVTVPYQEDFVRTRAHFSNLYYGASVAALAELGSQKGYTLVGSNSAGNNLFFVRDELRGDLPAISPEQAYVRAAFREARDERGVQLHLDFEERLQIVEHMEVYDLDRKAAVVIRDLR